MNRVLRRPMFRIGGSAEGITSGLDQTKLTASRPMYKRGRVVNPGGYQGDDEIDRALKSMEDERVQKFIRGERRPQWPQFLTSMGLDLLTRPKAGNIFQQVAASAKGPYEQWMGARAERGISEDKLKSALFGDVLSLETEKYKAEQDVLAEAEGADPTKTYEYKEKYKDYKNLIETQRDLEQQRKDLENNKKTLPPTGDPTIIDSQIDNVEKQLEDNIKYQNLFIGKEEDEVRKAILHGISNGIYTFEQLEHYDKTKKETGAGEAPREDSAEGGRIGYANAGAVMPNTIPRAMPAVMQAPGPTDQGQDDTVQDLSFEELRARLPQEITNDIVKLLSESKQALVDFANIRTQQDVNEFNQKYDVNLVVPQEV